MSSTMDNKDNNVSLERGKRKLARQILFAQLVFSVLGMWYPIAWTMAMFYAPFLIPSAIALYLGDAVQHAYTTANISSEFDVSK